MKPCRANRERIASLALGNLPEKESRQLQQHFHDCPACREYFRQISAVCQQHLAAAQSFPDVALPPSFHERLQNKIHSTEIPSPPPLIQTLARLWSSPARWLVPAAICLGIVALFLLPPNRQPQKSPATPIVSRTVSHVPQAPKLAAYRMAVNHSFEALDQLLNEQPVPRSLAQDEISLSRRALNREFSN